MKIFKLIFIKFKGSKIKLRYFLYFLNLILNFLIIFDNIKNQNKNIIKFNWKKYKKNYNNLIEGTKYLNKQILLKEKKELLKFISEKANRNISRIKTIYLGIYQFFGNNIILLYKAIFYCQILGCKRIILNKKYFWFISNKIISNNLKLTIKIGKENDYINNNKIIDETNLFFWYINSIMPKYRYELLKKEIYNNLPKVEINSNDLYIYIRRGDNYHFFFSFYIQPPLCFYENIINNFKLKNIYIIAENFNNPCINKLLNKYSDIIFNRNSLKLDIAYLINGFNIVGAYSTFLINVINLNDNLKNFWYFEFQIHPLNSIFFNLCFNHPNINVYKMKSPKNYYKDVKKNKNIYIYIIYNNF